MAKYSLDRKHKMGRKGTDNGYSILPFVRQILILLLSGLSQANAVEKSYSHVDRAVCLSDEVSNLTEIRITSSLLSSISNFSPGKQFTNYLLSPKNVQIYV